MEEPELEWLLQTLQRQLFWVNLKHSKKTVVQCKTSFTEHQCTLNATQLLTHFQERTQNKLTKEIIKKNAQHRGS